MKEGFNSCSYFCFNSLVSGRCFEDCSGLTDDYNPTSLYCSSIRWLLWIFRFIHLCFCSYWFRNCRLSFFLGYIFQFLDLVHIAVEFDYLKYSISVTNFVLVFFKNRLEPSFVFLLVWVLTLDTIVKLLF